MTNTVLWIQLQWRLSIHHWLLCVIYSKSTTWTHYTQTSARVSRYAYPNLPPPPKTTGL